MKFSDSWKNISGNIVESLYPTNLYTTNYAADRIYVLLWIAWV